MQEPREDAGHHPNEPVHTITSAADARSSDLDARIKRYLISMSIRTICFILAIVVTGPMRWVFIAGAVVLPYIAVIAANAPAARRGSGPRPPDRRQATLGQQYVGTLPTDPSTAGRTAGGQGPPNG